MAGAVSEPVATDFGVAPPEPELPMAKREPVPAPDAGATTEPAGVGDTESTAAPAPSAAGDPVPAAARRRPPARAAHRWLCRRRRAARRLPRPLRRELSGGYCPALVSRASRFWLYKATEAPHGQNARLWWQKWRWYERDSLPWNRLGIHRELARRRAFARWPLHGNVLEALREGRLEIGEGTLLEPHVWLTAPDEARIRIGEGTFLNIGVMVASAELVEFGDHCMFANGCFVTDANHRFDDPEQPITWQGFTSKGPTRVGDNVWCGANVVVTSGVTIGERCVIGANSVVTEDVPAYSIAAGAPAKVLRRVEYPAPPGEGSADHE